ncbi:hypothetical protein CUZ56_01390 [Saezia sanguinis]|uniref:Uncharacterized protein n=1 Tax=Saezia sanguinis TaxID=1965230 RepID=A0A433SFD4_9BURK|nr:ParB family protein [Saezia sanguinis]RUS67445.1 hypothetical protein CUZ56_01390 [Saezia sanguinis]
MNDKTLSTSLLAGNFDRQSPDAQTLSDPIADTFMVVTLDQLRPYDRNPRLTKNPRYDELSASIRQRGLDSAPPITRRPGETHYIIRNGGNTRLEILNELWKETRDEKYFRIGCMFKPWQGEIVALTGHLAEGELHGELTFIEKALGVQEARNLLTQELGHDITQKELSQKLSENGFPISQTLISRMNDTITYLLPAIPNALYGGLGGRGISNLLSLKNAVIRTWLKYTTPKATFSVEEATEMFQEILAVFDHQPEHFEFNRIKDEIIGRLAEHFQTTYDLMALEVSEDESRQRALNTPPTIHADAAENSSNPAFFENTPKPLVSNNNDITSSSAVLPIKTDKSADKPAAAGAHFIGLSSEEPLPQSQENSRVKNIQNLVVQSLEQNTEDIPGQNAHSLPAYADGLYPVTDIWLINPAQNTPDWIKIAIIQLVREIADVYGLAQHIEENNSILGYQCQLVESTSIGCTVLTFLNALNADATTNYSVELSALLIGKTAHQEPPCLSDTSLIKVFRLIRLSRRLIELNNINEPLAN